MTGHPDEPVREKLYRVSVRQPFVFSELAVFVAVLNLNVAAAVAGAIFSIHFYCLNPCPSVSVRKIR